MQLGWIDFSETDRKRALDVIHSLTEEGAMDELGIGVIRDAFSNLFFPGTSTIQTRAKYFFICPYAIEDACRKASTANDILKEIDRIERDCAEKMSLAAGSTIGIIGATKLDTWIVRKPYNIYWNGLKTFGILKDKVSVKDIARYFEEIKRKKDTVIRGKAMEDDEDNTGDDRDAGIVSTHSFWDIPSHEGWRDNLTIALTKEEAEFLEGHIMANVGESLLGIILKNRIQVPGIDSFDALCESLSQYVNDELNNTMSIARQFSDFSYFIGTAYNRYLLGKEAVAEHLDAINKDKAKYLSVNVDDVFSCLRLPKYTRTYNFLVNIHSALQKDGWEEDSNNEVKNLLIKQEIGLKGEQRAKLLHPERFSSWVGIGNLDYRFQITKRIVTDIYEAQHV